MYIEKRELLDALQDIFGNLADESGCNVLNTKGEYEWLSVSRIVDIIEECQEYEE